MRFIQTSTILVVLLSIIWITVTIGLILNVFIEFSFYVKIIHLMLSIGCAILLPVFLLKRENERIEVQKIMFKTLVKCMKRRKLHEED